MAFNCLRTWASVAACLCVVVILSLASRAGADLCKDCKGKAFIANVGACTNCHGTTSSGSFKYCRACSAKLGKCEACGQALTAAPPVATVSPVAQPAPAPATSAATQPSSGPAKPEKVNTAANDKYTFGKWTYDYTIGAEGSRSERRIGRLLYDGKPVGDPKRYDRIQTPWGTMQFFDTHYDDGWLLLQTYDRPLELDKGKLLPVPDAGTATQSASAPASVPATSQLATNPAKQFRIAFKKPKDSAKVFTESEAVVVLITNPDGIGAATIARTSGAWPAKLLIRFQSGEGDGFQTLESFAATAGKETFSGSEKTEPKRIRITKKYAEVELPANLLGEKETQLSIEWIDAYR